jgi:flavin-dependent dehydrogenase
MATRNPITIVGGGIAGLALGISLRQRDVPVTVHEAGQYPRHRVCGEFISGRGREILARLGLSPSLQQAGAIELKTARFIAHPNASPVRTVPPALGIARFDLDALMAAEFRRLGGELVHARWNGPAEPGVVLATGRRAQPTHRGWRWFGLKVHTRNIALHADLEMHLIPNGYVGVNRINHHAVNVCGLFRAKAGEAPPKNAFDLLRGPKGSPLHQLLENAVFENDSACSVAGLSLQPQSASVQSEFRIGDALTMIPPATGNGMSMALESAALAVDPLMEFNQGLQDWPVTRTRAAEAMDRAFSRRLRWAQLLQRLMLSPIASHPLGSGLMRSKVLWNFLFNRTR